MIRSRKIAVILALAVAFSLVIIAINSSRVLAEDDSGLVPVVITGQTTSFAPGDDGDLRMGVPWSDPRFNENFNGTVTDKLTGLIWLQDANCLGATKTWSEALGWSNFLESGACDLTDGSVASDWRLPNIKELQSLLDLGSFDPALPFPNPFTNVVSASLEDYYWSSTTLDVSPNDALMIRMKSGFVDLDSKIDGSEHFVWPVRSCFATKTHIESIIAETTPASKNFKIGKVTITVFDECGSPVLNAVVTGTFNGSFLDENISGTTDGNGVAVITTTGQAKKPLYEFCVSDVSSSLTYDSGGNVETCKSK